MKILTVVGARPQFIKQILLSQTFQKDRTIKEFVVHTGQHYDYVMSEVFFKELKNRKPHVNLNVHGQSHTSAIAKMLVGIEIQIKKLKPDLILVFGDTNSTLAGAVAAAKHNIPLAHVEAGERSYNRSMPEEVNRVITDHISTINFCVSKKGNANLKKEGIENSFVAGDLMYDAFLKFRKFAKWPSHISKPKNDFVFATIHRAENTDDPARLKKLLSYLSKLGPQVVMPLHPRTRKVIQENKLRSVKNVKFSNPVSYFESLALLENCAFVATDSGGLQREAYFAKKKCLILRNETEWSELVEAGAACLVNSPKTFKKAMRWIATPIKFPPGLLGRGNAAEIILKVIKNEHS